MIQSCLNCSGGFDVGFVGNNSGTLQFNQVFANASGRLNVKIWYANGDAAARHAFLSVNGGPGTSLTFPSTGSFQTVGSIQTTLNFLNPGSNNTLKFSNPIVGNWAPDFDRIEVTCTIPPPANLRPQDLFSWSSPGVRNLTSDGSRYFSIDSGSTNIVGFNQTPPGDFGDWLSEPCPQRHPLCAECIHLPRPIFRYLRDIARRDQPRCHWLRLGKCHNPLFGQYQHSRLCADGRQRDDWRIHCTRDSTKEGDSACDWP